jgi:DNA-binding response OmpR family regulator
MAHLRQKLEDVPNEPRFFRTESGIGYRFSGE